MSWPCHKDFILRLVVETGSYLVRVTVSRNLQFTVLFISKHVTNWFKSEFVSAWKFEKASLVHLCEVFLYKYWCSLVVMVDFSDTYDREINLYKRFPHLGLCDRLKCTCLLQNYILCFSLYCTDCLRLSILKCPQWYWYEEQHSNFSWLTYSDCERLLSNYQSLYLQW